MNKSEDGSGPAGYEITDGQCVSPLENPTKRKDVVEEDRRDDGETNETTPGRVSYLAYQRRAQDRPMWKQQAEAFVQPCDTMTATMMMIMMMTTRISLVLSFRCCHQRLAFYQCTHDTYGQLTNVRSFLKATQSLLFCVSFVFVIDHLFTD